MFETHDGAEINIPPQLRDSDQHYWEYVQLGLFAPWLLIVYKTQAADGQITRTLLSSKLDLLIELQQDPNYEVIEVSLVSPGHVNKTNQWKMEALEKVRIGQEPDLDHEQEAIIFVLKNGRKYVDSGLGTPINKLVDITTVYSH